VCHRTGWENNSNAHAEFENEVAENEAEVLTQRNRASGNKHRAKKRKGQQQQQQHRLLSLMVSLKYSGDTVVMRRAWDH
jgi:hypothetical protein